MPACTGVGMMTLGIRSGRDNRARQYDSDMTTEACQYDSDVATEARCTFDSVPLV